MKKATFEQTSGWTSRNGWSKNNRNEDGWYLRGL